ncbi:MAG: prepilin-type N-terminal cleavage/methylation domain-containing protein [Verrucomicrobiia bacterium]|jgi:prepilin-type N-terminal cleavage/methylation domain-containing protein
MRFFPKKKGFTLIEVMIVLAILALLLSVAIPSYLRARRVAFARTCSNNLRIIEAAKQVWGVENGKKPTDVPTESDLVGPNLYLKVMPVCPAGGVYSINSIGEYPTCSIPDHTYGQ